MKAYLELMRPWQWYKNFLVFLPIILTAPYSTELYLRTLIGFVFLCLSSSAGYVLNDYVDREKDRLNPEKANRSFPSGRVSGLGATLIFTGIMIPIIFVGAGNPLLLPSVLLLVSNILYSLVFREVFLVDSFLVASNYSIRLLQGEVLSGLRVSKWFYLLTFSIGLLLAQGKRQGELEVDRGGRRTLKDITPVCHLCSIVLSSVLAIMSLVMSLGEKYVILMPIGLFLLLRYLSVLEKDPRLARHPHGLLRRMDFAAPSIIFLVLYLLLREV